MDATPRALPPAGPSKPAWLEEVSQTASLGVTGVSALLRFLTALPGTWSQADGMGRWL